MLRVRGSPERLSSGAADRIRQLGQDLCRSPLVCFGFKGEDDAVVEGRQQDAVHVLDRTVDVHIGRLRDKIEPAPSQPTYVLTIRGLGYKFRDEDDA